jgi:hypothetical protein
MITVILMLILFGGPSVAENAAQGWRTHSGAWFQVKYPANFTVRPSQRSSSAGGFDSAFFTAPDGSVEFYVFSPQWNGEPSDIALDSQTEVSVSQTTQRSGSKIIRRATIKARDGGYTRSLEDIEDTATNTRRVFGIKYVSQAAYNRYRQTYLTFKQSLTQFAD